MIKSSFIPKNMGNLDIKHTDILKLNDLRTYDVMNDSN